MSSASWDDPGSPEVPVSQAHPPCCLGEGVGQQPVGPGPWQQRDFAPFVIFSCHPWGQFLASGSVPAWVWSPPASRGWARPGIGESVQAEQMLRCLAESG